MTLSGEALSPLPLHDHDDDLKLHATECSYTTSTSMRKRRLVLFPCPYLQGHINPMLQLATLLHTKGFSITIIHTRFNSPNPSDYPHFHFVPISSSPGSDIDQFHLQHSTTDIVAFINALNVKFLSPFRDCLIRLLSLSSSPLSQPHTEKDGDSITCVITDALMHFTQDVANNLQIPRIVLRTSSPTSFVAFAAYPLLLQKGYLPIQDSELEKPVPELAPLKVKDLPTVKTNDPELLYELVIQMVEKTKSASGLIFNSFESLEHIALDTIRRDFIGVPIFPIGPFHKWSPASSSSIFTEDQSCIPWLDEQAPKSVIYVSFGSLADMEETELIETAWGLVNSGHPFLWVVRPGLVRSSSSVEHLLPDGFQEMIRSTGNRGCLVKWAPQEQVLAHPAVGGFWTHNGWNSTLESVCEGVPMLCRPCFTDQLVNARYVSDVWKVGFQFDDGRPSLDRGDVERAIKRLMRDADLDQRTIEHDGETMMARVQVLKEKADNCLKRGGSSFESVEKLIDLIMSF